MSAAASLAEPQLALCQKIGLALSQQVKDAQEQWAGWRQSKRARRVAQYRLLHECLVHLSAEASPTVPSPWTNDEVFESMRDYDFAGECLKSSNGMLSVDDSKLVRAVRVTERTLRKCGRVPASLN
jgi:hypothetical protein